MAIVVVHVVKEPDYLVVSGESHLLLLLSNQTFRFSLSVMHFLTVLLTQVGVAYLQETSEYFIHERYDQTCSK